MIKLTQKQIEKIQTKSRENYPKESAFGITKKGIAVELKNIAKDPIKDFKINSAEFYDKQFVALVHSHTVVTGAEFSSPHMWIDPRSPSEMDQKTYYALGEIPFGILAITPHDETDILWFKDLEADILGQEYITFVNDCLTVCERYYWQNHKIKMKQYTRSAEWWEADPDKLLDSIIDSGFEVVPQGELKVGDMLLITIGPNSSPSHCGIYVGNDEIIHHSPNRKSEKVSYTRYMKRISHVLRHPEVNT